MNYTVNQSTIHYDARGSRAFGDDCVLLQHAIDLSAKTSWAAHGFSIEKLFTAELFQSFQEKTYPLLMDCWRRAGLSVPQNLELDCYHAIVPSWELHVRALEKTKLLPTSEFPVDIMLIEQRISEICQVDLQVKNPFDDQSVFHFRVIRPASNDNNPLHRDVWLEDYKDCINLYIPVAGSNEKSSLILIPGSHHWSESRIEKTIEGAEINGVKFNVPDRKSVV